MSVVYTSGTTGEVVSGGGSGGGGSGSLMSDELSYFQHQQQQQGSSRLVDKNSITINQLGSAYYRSEEDYYSSVFGGSGSATGADSSDISIDNDNEIILDGETQIRFLGNIRVWQLAATFLLGCVLLMFLLIVVVKVINKIQKEKYLMLLMMEAKLGELEKKSYTLLKSGLSHSLERIYSISSRLNSSTDYWRRRMCKKTHDSLGDSGTSPTTSRSASVKANNGVVVAAASASTPAVESIYECPLSVSDLAYTNHCFKLEEYDDSNITNLQLDSFA